MKKLTSFIVATVLVSGTALLAQPAKKVASTGGTSPHETTSAVIDGCRVTITYGRPFTKDPKTASREKSGAAWCRGIKRGGPARTKPLC
jgi:hypothetical protein